MPPHTHHQVHPSSGNSNKRTPQMTEYKPKNELIANGIRCEKCNKTVKRVEPISKLIMAVRDHVLTHFDSENPLLKRFECREHLDFRTNFVDEFEKHLHKHNAFNSLPERRQLLCVNLTRLPPRGRGLTALQLQYLVDENRINPNPFRIHFVNYNRKDSKVKELEKDKTRFLQNPDVFCPIVTEGGLETTFESQEVIYLSPDDPELLEPVEDDKVYVIGGIVDRVVEHGIPKHASLEAALSAKVSPRKLPIDRYVDFKSGSKFLTLLAVAEILRQVNLHGNWKRAMEVAIPVRNISGVEEKNQKSRTAYARIHQFNQEILRRVDRILGKDNCRFFVIFCR